MAKGPVVEYVCEHLAVLPGKQRLPIELWNEITGKERCETSANHNWTVDLCASCMRHADAGQLKVNAK
jgi:hypothetical protein